MPAQAARAGRLVACVAAAAALQAGAWRVAAAVIGRETVGAGTVHAAAHAPVRLRTLPGPAAPGPRRVVAADVPRAQPALPTPPAAKPVPILDGSAATQRPFYEYREVDVPAEPVAEWNLDPAALDAQATSRIVFTLFVGSDGTVLHCTVDEPERLDAAVRRALAARLCETPMRPARRGGQAVASRRRLELFTEGGV